MCNSSDTGLNETLSDIGLTSGMFHRDTPALFKMLDSCQETVSRIEKLTADIGETTFGKKQAE